MKTAIYGRVSTKEKAKCSICSRVVRVVASRLIKHGDTTGVPCGSSGEAVDESANAGQDTENQLRALREFALQQNWEVVEEYTDNSSGSGKVKRPAFEKMMSDAVNRKVDMVLFWSLDRLSREGVGKTVGYLDKLTAAGVCWRSFTEQYLDSCGIFKDAVLAILAVVAKQERIRISERTIAGLATARAKGRFGGRKPKDKPIGKIKELRAEGMSLGEIAAVVGLSKATVARVCA